MTFYLHSDIPKLPSLQSGYRSVKALADTKCMSIERLMEDYDIVYNCDELGNFYNVKPSYLEPFDHENPMDYCELRDFYILHNGEK
jgi:hypothetical protein